MSSFGRQFAATVLVRSVVYFYFNVLVVMV
jgi:hypothetical protein